MRPFPRLSLVIAVASFLAAWNRGARADELFERLSALRLLQLQSNLWNPIEKNGLTLGGGVEGRYTTNAALARDGTGDWYLTPSASMIWSHKLQDDWRVSVGSDVGGYRYLRQPDLGTSYVDAWGSVARDFRIGPVKTGIYVTCTQQWTQLRNFSKSGSTTEILAGLNADWEIRAGHTLSFNPVAYATPYSSPWDSGYHSYGAMISYNWEVTHGVGISVYYNGYLTDYFSGQTDFTQFVGMGITWNPCENFSFTASVNQTWNSSTNPGSEYSALDAGGTLGFQWRL